MNVFGFKVDQKMLLCCVVAFVLGYLFASRVEGWTRYDDEDRCVDNQFWGEAESACKGSHDLTTVMKCIGSLDQDTQDAIDEEYPNDELKWGADAWKAGCAADGGWCAPGDDCSGESLQ